MTSFKKIALAIAFSPTAPAMVRIGSQLAAYFGAQLIIIHVGAHGAEEEKKMNEMLLEAGIRLADVTLFWETGDPAKGILKVCRHEKTDLLIAGALKTENLLKYYIGTIARNIMRKAECAVLMISNPSAQSIAFKNIVVQAEDHPYMPEAIALACHIGNKSHASWVHIVRGLKLYGLTMANEDCPEEEYDGARHKLVNDEIIKVEEIVHSVPGEKPKLNIKIISGKSGFELSRFAERKQADLLIVTAPQSKVSFFSRV